MALKLTLRPGERIILGGAVVRNGDSRCHLLIENEVPVLREKNIMSQHEADSPARRIYFAIQLMYVDPAHIVSHHQLYWQLVREFLQAAPSALPIVDRISELICANNYYGALKATRQLIDYEREVMERARKRSENLRGSGKGDQFRQGDRSPGTHPGRHEDDRVPAAVGQSGPQAVAG